MTKARLIFTDPLEGAGVCAHRSTFYHLTVLPNHPVPKLRLKLLRLLLCCTFGLSVGWIPNALAQQVTDNWTAHTSFSAASGLALTGTHAWVATAGGVYSVERSSGSISRFTVVDGLSNVGASAIASDEARSLIWVGYDDGLLDRIDTVTGGIKTFRDIERADQFPAKGINKILVEGDSLMIATEFGIVVFDPVRNEVRDSFTRFGNLAAGSPITDILVESDLLSVPTIWATSEGGLARAPLNNVNLQDPASWINEKIGSGINSKSAYSLATLGNVLYVGTEDDVYSRGAFAVFQKLNVTNRTVTQLSSGLGVIVGGAQFTVIVIREAAAASAHSIEGMPFPISAQFDSAGRLWIVDASTGLGSGSVPVEGSGVLQLDSITLPSGPADGLFSRISIAEDSRVWVSGVLAAGTGFYTLDSEGVWTTYSTSTTPELAGKGAFLHVFAASDGTGWAASEGAGVASVEPDGTVTTYSPTNSSLVPVPGSANFVVMGGLHEDNIKNMWFTTRGSSRPLHVRQENGTWTAFGPKIGQGLLSSSTAYGRIYVDSFDEKWIIVHQESNFRSKKGLMVLDSGIPENAADDEFQFFGTKGGSGQGLPSISVNAVAEDKDGLVWVATESGPAYFINTGIVARDGSATAIWPQWADRSRGVFMLFGLNIRDLAVDPAGRIWFATDNGAWLVESVEGGYELVHHFTKDNSPIFSDEVLAVAVDGESGEVYFSTDRGMVSFASDAIAPRRASADLKIFPNPVRFDGGMAPDVFIEGLVPAASIRIVTSAGFLVRRLNSRGGRIRWDGKDENGKFVSSGVYLVIAVGENNEGAAYGKIAVVR